MTGTRAGGAAELADRASPRGAVPVAPVRLVAVAGLLGAAAITLGSALTAAAYRGRHGEAYSPLDHFVSELGQLSVSTLAPLFNTSLVVAGTCLAVFLVGLATRFRGRAGTALAGIGAINGLFGSLVGVFPMDHLGVHRFVSLTYFATAWLSVGLVTLQVARGRWALPRWLVVPGVLTVAAYLAFIYAILALPAAARDTLEETFVRPRVWDVTVTEWLAIGTIVAWVAIVASTLLASERRGGTS